MILINTVNDKYFTIDGIQFARIYQPLAQGSAAIGIYNIYDTRQQLKNSTDFNQFNINGVIYGSQSDTVAAILAVVWSGVSDADVESLEERVDNLEENQYSGVLVYSTYAGLPATGTLLVSYKVTNDSDSSLNGYYHWSGSVYIKDADLVSNLLDPLNTSDAVSGKAIDLHIDDKLLESENLFNPDLAEDNKYYQNGTGNVLTNTGWSITGLQRVQPSTDYICWIASGLLEKLHFYDNDGVWISETAVASASQHVFTTPLNCYYVATWSIRAGLTFQEFKDSVQIELGSVKTELKPYNQTLKEDLVPDNSYTKQEADAPRSENGLYKDNTVQYIGENLPDNLIEGEGTDGVNPFPVVPDDGEAGILFTSEDNDGVLQKGYAKKRVLTGTAASGSCYAAYFVSYPSPMPDAFSFRFWVKDSDIEGIYSTSDTMEFWLYDGGIFDQLNIDIRSLVVEVGNEETGTFNNTGFGSGDTKAACLGKSEGFSCIAVSWLNVVYDGGFVPSSQFSFYHIFNNVVAALNGNSIDFVGFTFRFEEIVSSFAYPDASGKEQFPQSTEKLQSKVESLEEGVVDYEVIVLRENNYVYLRTNFSSAFDLVQRFEVYKEENFFNNCVNISNAYLIDYDAGNSSAIYEAGTLIASNGDDSCPNNYNGTFIGANHGLDKLRVVTANGHGKTAVDIGSEWTDGAAVKWYILRIVDINTIWMLSEDSSVSDIWDFNGTLTGNLTHSSGATHTGAITVASVVNSQLYPAVKNQVKKVLINGETEITSDGIYYASFVDIVNTYDIVNPASMLDNLVANVGTSYSDADLHLALQDGTQSVFNQILNRIQKNGANEVVYGWRNYQDIDLDYMGFVQAAVLSTSDYPQVKLYAPKALPISDGTTIFDFRNIEDWTVAPLASLNLIGSYWEVPASPPERTVQYLADAGGNRKIGFAQGYDLTKGIGTDRQNLVDNALSLYTSRKNYLHGIDSKLGNVAENTWYSCIGYRIYFDAETADKDNATDLYYYELGKEVIVVFDYHTTANFDSLKLPSEYVGMNVTVVEKSSNVTIHTSEVMQDGLTVSVSAGNYAYCVLKLS